MYRHFFSFVFIIMFLVSCNKEQVTVNEQPKSIDSLAACNLQATQLKREQVRSKENSDSIFADSIVDEALAIIRDNLSQPVYRKKFKSRLNEDLCRLDVELKLGNLFTPDGKHAFVRLEGCGNIFLNIFKIKGNTIIPVVKHEEWELTHVTDSIADVNGDGLQDLMVNWYGSSGCCLKNFYDVFLSKPDGSFTEGYNFANPTFSAKERIVRGVGYGHPGEVELYKFRWKGYKLDTVEYIFPYPKNPIRFVKTKSLVSRDTEKDWKILDEVPNEYKNIYGFDWFIGYDPEKVLNYNK